MSTTPQNPEALQRIFTARTAVNAKMPYLRSMTNALVPVEAPGLGTVATTANLHFVYDPEFLLRVTDPLMLGGLLLHEMLHHLKQHRARRLAFGLADGDKGGDRRKLHLWNIAGDLENNRDIEQSGFKLPGKPIIPFDPCYCRDFKDKDGKTFPENLLAEDYFALLLDRPEEPEQGDGEGEGGAGGGEGEQGGASGQGEGEGEGDASGSGQGAGKGRGKGRGQGGQGDGASGPARVGAGRCGSACGDKVDGEPEGTEKAGRATAEVDSIRGDVARALRDHIAQKGVGSVPAGFARWAEKADEEIPVPWWTVLTRACQRAVAWAQGQVDHKYDRPSRRQAGIGFGIGSGVMPALRRPIPNVWVGVDTSASMGTKDVSVVLQVVEEVMKVTNRKVTFLACDTEVHTQKEVASWREAVELIKGGGGTDFNPVFEAATKARPDQRPQVLVFVTDGQGPAPETAPVGIKVLWLLVGPYATAPCEWGDQIVLGENVKAPA